MSVIEIFKLGRKYMELWPKKAELNHYFDEYRAVQIGRLVYRYLPAMALFVLIMQLYFGGADILAQALVYFLFLLSIPLQAVVMLGVKADKFLPPALADWYRRGVAKVNEQDGDIKLSIRRPRYLDLATLLNVSYANSRYRL
ncbi:terminus macrodomain insulation protein YfbV [Thalassotalea profundi]|nr:terminus macrodomain insulation protein YfbV [Thalassotalea profundi]